MHQQSFSYIPLASEITDKKSIENVGNEFAGGLATINGHRVRLEQIDGNAPLLMLVISGGTEAVIAECVAKRNPEFNREPLTLIAHPGNNSLAASLEALALIRQRNLKGEIVFFKNGNDILALNKLAEVVRNVSVSRRLQQSRVGLVGKPSEWLVASVFDDAQFKSTWGVNILHFTLAEVFQKVADESTQNMEQTRISGFDSSKEQFRRAFKVFELLDNLAKAEHLDAVSVECFRLFHYYHTHGCFALSRLNDSGIVAGCEGDLVSTLAMLWLKYLLGQVCWMANPVEINSDEHTLWLAHCTVPTSLVTDFNQATHFETGCGVAISGRFADGPVTLLRIGGVHLDRIWVADAEIIAAGDSPYRCRTQALVKFEDASALDELMNNPLGNHLVLTRGAHAENIYTWWNRFIS